MSTRQISASKEIYGIEDWGQGYFNINQDGDVVSCPLGSQFASIPLPEIIKKAKESGVCTPMIIRFPQIIEGQLSNMHNAFSTAIDEFNYSGNHFGVFPFKVNQRREFIDSIVSCGRDLKWGLEVGSKTELMAALSYQLSPESLLVCNGFKDREFIDIAFAASKMGKNMLLVVEGPDELSYIINKLSSLSPEDFDQAPQIGLRVRLYSRGSGKWEKSSGETSKFGLTTIELMHALNLLQQAGLKEKLAMLHFHIGSQITAIKRFKNALKEAARVYAKICKMGYHPKFMNIGGGVGVDYDGSNTSGQSSANYNLQEFANDAIFIISEVCAHEQVHHPHIVTESGRVIAAFHSVIVTDIREVQGEEDLDDIVEFDRVFSNKDGQGYSALSNLKYNLDNMSSKNYIEFYHDAIEYHEELYTLFNLGFISLEERAVGEDLYQSICHRALYFSSFQKHIPEEFVSLQNLKVSKYLANFSIFQSIPDAWSIDQLFPVMPLSRHREKPLQKGSIVDITCDSDGCLDRYIDRNSEKAAIELHSPNGEPYYLGFFLVGAYQESLANEHNLFGAIHEVEVLQDRQGNWEISKTTHGDSIRELLVCRNYNSEEMEGSYAIQLASQLSQNKITKKEACSLEGRMKAYLDCYPYLKEKDHSSYHQDSIF